MKPLGVEPEPVGCTSDIIKIYRESSKEEHVRYPNLSWTYSGIFLSRIEQPTHLLVL